LADRRAIARASKELVQALARAKGSDAADLPAIIDCFKRKIGGNEAIADMLVQDVRRLHGADLPPEEEEHFQYHEQVIQKYHQMVLKMISEKDDKAANYDLSSLSEDDLHSILVPLAKELLVKDKGFREEVLTLVSNELQSQKPGYSAVIDGEVLEGEPSYDDRSVQQDAGQAVPSG
jgi:hypothetical protein